MSEGFMTQPPQSTPDTGATSGLAGDQPARLAHVIVVGNEKGGAGKSTVSMHLCIALLRMGMRSACSTSTSASARCRAISRTAPLDATRRAADAGDRPGRASQARDLDAAEEEEAQHFDESVKRLPETLQFHHHRCAGRRQLPVAAGAFLG